MSRHERIDQRRSQGRGTLVRPGAAPARSVSPEHGKLLNLQHAVGNRAVASMLGAQLSLQVGRSDDRYEKEADQVAERVVASIGRSEAGPAPEVGHDHDHEGLEPDELESHAHGLARTIKRRVMPGAPIGAEGGPVSGDLERDLQAARSGGAPLPGPARSQMERAFGADFGAVRVHEGPSSTDLNRQLGASAFTLGQDIFFGGATASLSSKAGQGLLAHELTHVVQQGAARTKDDAEP